MDYTTLTNMECYGMDKSIIRTIGEDNLDELNIKFSSSPFPLSPALYLDFTMGNELTKIRGYFKDKNGELVIFPEWTIVKYLAPDMGYIVLLQNPYSTVYNPFPAPVYPLNEEDILFYSYMGILSLDTVIYSEVSTNNKIKIII